MSLVDVGQGSEVPTGTMKSYSVGGKQVLIANINGKLYAVDSICTHAGGDLSKGKLEGEIVTCPKHHSKFNLATGKCISGPQIGFLKLKTKDISSYEVKAEDNRIKVNIP